MDGLTFTSHVIDALAWPAAALVILFVLRAPLLELIRLIRSVKYGDVELGFAKELSEIAASASPHALESTAPSPGQPSRTLEPKDQHRSATEGAKPIISVEMAKLAETAPAAAVQSAWLHLSRAAVEAVRRSGTALPSDGPISAEKVEPELMSRGILSPADVARLHRLRKLNQDVIAKRGRVTSEIALDYGIIANQLAMQLDRWQPRG